MYNQRRRYSILVISIRPLVVGLHVSQHSLQDTGVDEGKTYPGSITFAIYAHDARLGLKSLTVKIYSDSQELLALSGTQQDCIPWTIDRSLRKNTTQCQLTFASDNTPPQIHVPTESWRVGQGRALALFVQINEALAQMPGKLFNRDITIYPVESATRSRALVGISPTHSAKTNPVSVEAADLVGNTGEETFQIKVISATFERGGHIVFSPEKQKVMMDSSKNREDNVKRDGAHTRSTTEDIQLWEGKFIRPTNGRLTSPFGKYRECNTGVRRHHLGTDIVNDVGTPAYAGNHDIVTLATRLHIHGNSVLINHGQGISTSYNHVSGIHVMDGERAEKRTTIGLMGATGQVTGSHLHWGMALGGVAVGAGEWVEQDFSLT